MVEHIVEEKKIRRFVNTGFRVTHQHKNSCQYVRRDLINLKIAI
jgi:hypothetical protein